MPATVHAPLPQPCTAVGSGALAIAFRCIGCCAVVLVLTAAAPVGPKAAALDRVLTLSCTSPFARLPAGGGGLHRCGVGHPRHRQLQVHRRRFCDLEPELLCTAVAARMPGVWQHRWGYQLITSRCLSNAVVWVAAMTAHVPGIKRHWWGALCMGGEQVAWAAVGAVRCAAAAAAHRPGITGTPLVVFVACQAHSPHHPCPQLQQAAHAAPVAHLLSLPSPESANTWSC